MVYRGCVKNGVVVLDEPGAIKDGTSVEIEPLPRPRKRIRKPAAPRTLYDVLKPVFGIAKGLPPDAARNHDHYLHGQPKR